MSKKKQSVDLFVDSMGFLKDASPEVVDQSVNNVHKGIFNIYYNLFKILNLKDGFTAVIAVEDEEFTLSLLKNKKMLEKSMQIVAACAVWLNYAGEILRKDKGFYKQKNKMLLNALLDSNLDVINDLKRQKL